MGLPFPLPGGAEEDVDSDSDLEEDDEVDIDLDVIRSNNDPTASTSQCTQPDPLRGEPANFQKTGVKCLMCNFFE